MSKKNNTFDIIQQAGAWFSAIVTIVVCFGIIVFLFIKGYTALSWEFLSTEPGAVIGNVEKGGGILTPIIGTFIITLLGILVAFPWALATAIYLTEYARKNLITNYFKTAIDILAGVPTIVIAIFGLAVFSNPQFGFLSSMVEGVEGVNRAFGRSYFVCGIGMAVMILPYVIKTCEEAIKAVPNAFREASLAMGATKWYTIVHVILLSARKGIITAVILGMGRIIGDTAIVWLLLGGTLRMTGAQPWWALPNWLSTLKNTGSTLTTYIYFYSPAGEGNMAELAFGAAIVLIVIIILFNTVADLVGTGSQKLKEE